MPHLCRFLLSLTLLPLLPITGFTFRCPTDFTDQKEWCMLHHTISVCDNRGPTMYKFTIIVVTVPLTHHSFTNQYIFWRWPIGPCFVLLTKCRTHRCVYTLPLITLYENPGKIQGQKNKVMQSISESVTLAQIKYNRRKSYWQINIWVYRCLKNELEPVIMC